MPHVALVGSHIAQSLSPMIHQVYGEALGSYTYGLAQVSHTSAFNELLASRKYSGFNVTMPYKKHALQLAETASQLARDTGSANTLIRTADDAWYAENTDVFGVIWMLNRLCQQAWSRSAADVLRTKTVAILGAGGAAQAASCALHMLNAHPVMIPHQSDTYDKQLIDLDSKTPISALINATPVGMSNDSFTQRLDSPVSFETLTSLHHLQLVGDMIYAPLRTRLLTMAHELKLPALGGISMLAAQAYASALYFSGTISPADSSSLLTLCSTEDATNLIDCAIDRVVSQKRAVALIGMPGVGKSTIGALLAKHCAMPFIDTDEVYRQTYREAPEETIERFGETVFREREAEVVAGIAKTHAVVAYGGGVPERCDNRCNLASNALVIYIKRPLSALSYEGRPISLRDGVETLFERRHPLYQSICDVELTAGATADDTARTISELLTKNPPVF